MARDFYPRRESDIVSFTRNFSGKLSEDPQHFGVTPEMAAAYAELVGLFRVQHQATQEKAVRSMSMVFAKDQTKRRLEDETRALARLARATPGVSPEDLILLGIPQRAPGRGSRIGPPTMAPVFSSPTVSGRRVTLRLRQEAGSLRGDRPRGVSTAVVFAQIADQPSDDPGRWQFVALTGNPTVEVHFNQPELTPGTKVWLVARWANPRGEMGPNSYPVCAYLQQEVALPGALKAA